jgi:putative intracellular protease/amidase
MNPDTLWAVSEAVAFAKAFFDSGKPVASICHRPLDSHQSRGARDVLAVAQDQPPERRRGPGESGGRG